MKSVHLSLMALAVLTIAEARNEIRERCSEPTLQKFTALETQLQDAMKEGVTTDGPPVDVIDPAVIVAAFDGMGNLLADRVEATIRSIRAQDLAAAADAGAAAAAGA